MAVTTAIYRKNTVVPRDRTFRIVSYTLEAVAFSGGSATIQARVYGPTSSTSAVISSGPLLIGSVPKRFHRRLPATASVWFPQDTLDGYVLIAIDQICQSKSESDQVRWLLKVEFEISPEQFTEACPANLALGSGMVCTGCDRHRPSTSGTGSSSISVVDIGEELEDGE